MPNDEQGFEAQDPDQAKRRENALAFIRHPSAFVYSEEDYIRLIAIVHDGLSERVEPRDRPREQGES